MARYFIEDTKCAVGETGIGMSVMDEPTVSEALVRTDSGERFYLSLLEIEGMLGFYKSAHSLFDVLIGTNSDEAAIEEADSCSVASYEGYWDLFEEPDPEWFELLRYLIYIARSDWDECERFQKVTRGHWLDEFETPMSDEEAEYREEMDQDEDGEL